MTQKNFNSFAHELFSTLARIHFVKNLRYRTWRGVTELGRKLQNLERSYRTWKEVTELEGSYRTWKEDTELGRKLQNLEGSYISCMGVTELGEELQSLE